MDDNHLMDVIEVYKHIDLNKEIFKQENELESDGDDDVPEVAHPDNVAQEIREPKEIVCKNPSRAQGKCGVKGR
ncbi:hypothetical protein Tco_0532580 [Tanacetum coccineum]